jgi:cytochrome c oxidase assembly protein subunit 15
MSGIYGLLIVFIWFQARKFFEKPSFGRSAAKATLIFMVIEALLGAKLVLFKLVTTNATPYRAFVMALHQVNSFMLTGAIALTYFASQSTSAKSKNLKPESLYSPSEYNKYRFFPLVIIILAITGAWAALSNSLFPENNLAAGFIADFSESSHFLIRLRIFHPIFAILGAGSLALFFWVKAQTFEESTSRKNALVLSLILVSEILFGLATLFFHAPSWMKIIHLGFAHLIWIFLLKWLYLLKIAPTVDR